MLVRNQELDRCSAVHVSSLTYMEHCHYAPSVIDLINYTVVASATTPSFKGAQAARVLGPWLIALALDSHPNPFSGLNGKPGYLSLSSEQYK